MTKLSDLIDVKYPIILAPMFLVTDVSMVKSALDSGISAAIPAMNFRNPQDLTKAIEEIKNHTDNAFGVNLIANRSNIKLEQQLEACLHNPPAFIITSLGNPKEIIKRAHEKGVKVFCDVTDLKYAQKVEQVGADALIAVNDLAGGHVGNISRNDLLNTLIKNCKIPVINAGGVASSHDLKAVLDIGAAGCSIGTLFIASTECCVNDEYKQALINYGKDDIVLTRKLSGAPTTVINTDYVKSIGTKPSFLELLVNKNTRLKKFAKSIITRRGQNRLLNAAFKATYKTVWVASCAIENIKEIRTIKEIVDDLTKEIKTN
ncbi:MAG: nitronate monooxygenase [Bacteroidales bacterium]|nr:nitronate monooxygenase [Bacteroidales bacterium]